MQSTQVVYLMSGKPHLPYLLVSLFTLRKHYGGEVWVYAWPESFPIVEEIARDSRLDIHAWQREPRLRKKDGVGNNSQFLDKIDLVRGWLVGDPDGALYLDGDTSIHGDISPLIDQIYTKGFVATQWNDWTTAGRTVQGRLKSLLGNQYIDESLVKHLLSHKYPSLNGGVWGAVPGSPLLPQWYEWAIAACPSFIADEKVLHLLMARFFPHSMSVVTDKGKWNSSPKHQSKELSDDDVVIRHYHGDSNVRPQKSPKGYAIWWPLWQECLSMNLGSCDDWRGEVGNDYIRTLEEKHEGVRY